MIEQDEYRNNILTNEFLRWLSIYLSIFERKISANENTNYLVGKKRTIADIALAAIAYNIIDIDEANPNYSMIANITNRENYPFLT